MKMGTIACRGAMMEQLIMRSERQRYDLARSCPTPCSGERIVFTAVQATLRRFNVCPLVAGLRGKCETQGANNAHDRTEFGIAGLPQRLVEALAMSSRPSSQSHLCRVHVQQGQARSRTKSASRIRAPPQL